MSNTEGTVVAYGEGYKESDDFVPNPTDQFGTLDTSGTAGVAHSKIEEISPVFEIDRKQNLATAARALDPEDTEVPTSLVVFPNEDTDRDKITERVQKAADAAASEPVQIGSYRGPAARSAEESGDQAGRDAEAEQQNADSGALDGSNANRADGSGQTDQGTATEGDKPKGGRGGRSS